MTRTPLLVLGLLVALAAVGWLLLSGDEVPGSGADEIERASSPGRAPADDRPAPPVFEPLPDAEERAEQMRTRPKWPVRSTDKIPRGGLDVIVADGEGNPLDAKGVTVRVEREQAAFWSAPLGVFRADTRTWEFRRLPIGRVEVTVRGPHIRAATAKATVQAKQVEPVTVTVEAGGAIAYTTVYYSGEKPKTMKLQLSLQGRPAPIPAWYAPSNASARRAATVTVGPDGRIEALAPGAYVIRAESDEREVDIQNVTVVAGETAAVELQLRK